jgi:murein DD-endopeptidase MepM/ murein hydrolase activator NlpD
MFTVFKGLVLIFCLVIQLIFGDLFLPGTAWAANEGSVPELQQKQKNIDDYRSSVNQAKQKLEAQEKSARDRLGGLGQQIKATASQIESEQDKLKTATEKLKQIEKELSVYQAKYSKQQMSTAARLRFLQRQTNSQGWVALMQSRSLEDLMDRQYQLKRVYSEDQKALVALKQAKAVIEAKKVETETQKNHIALITQQLAIQKASAEDQAQSENILVNRLKSDREALSAAEQQLAAESDQITKNIQQKLAANIAFPGTIFVPGSGKFILPAEGPMTSPFGWRIHPISGDRRFHNGLDFGAEYGSLIKAADNGVVIAAEWTGGYGNAVIIDHGNGLTTLYGHTSQMYVTAGQVVRKGQPIAAVGSTGFSTGPHLHFEVRRQGEPIDPMPFL